MFRKKVAAVAHTIGIDTGKNVLHVIGLDERGSVVVREKVSRSRIVARLVNVPRCLIGIEAGMANMDPARAARFARNSHLTSSIPISSRDATPVAIAQSNSDSGTVWNAICRNGM